MDRAASLHTSALRYYARQPILTAQNHVYAYELLFRNGPESDFRGDGNQATRALLDNSVLFGMERLTGGLPAFVNCTLEALTKQLVEVLPPSLTVLEILETLEPTPELITACRKLSAHGYQLALDDFVWRPELTPLIEIADYIKVDFLQSNADQRSDLLKNLRGQHIKLLAEKVETQSDFEIARAEGFTLFQGFYFCRPTLMEESAIPANKLSQLELLRTLQRSEFDLCKVGKLVERDAAITYRLLRLVNSPMYAIRHEIRSVEAALMVVGEDAFRRVALLAIASVLTADEPPEVLRMALARARFCELAAQSTNLDPTEQYLLGLFSLLPAMLRVPMEQAVASLPLRGPIREALLGEKVPERSLLCWAEASEVGDWSQCDAVQQFLQVNERQLVHCAAEAVTWAEATLHTAT